ncbi:Uncharacterized protein TCM_017803 [Theobroma cacao]|uniref:Uncharacterized protein n=1 Tax=Theobroma cacao TaxID=3641 RepID=A0A061EE07_THECC|nr:Uncharacterized protein TCM_017803 [Theobroma cacao]
METDKIVQHTEIHHLSTCFNQIKSIHIYLVINMAYEFLKRFGSCQNHSHTQLSGKPWPRAIPNRVVRRPKKAKELRLRTISLSSPGIQIFDTWSIRPVRHSSEWDIPPHVKQIVVLPPPWRGQARRLIRRRIPSAGEGNLA